MRKGIWAWVLLLSTFELIAQRSANFETTLWLEQPSDFDPIQFRGNKIDSTANLVNACKLFARNHLSEYFPAGTDLGEDYRTKSGIGHHITLYQSFMGERILGSEVKFNLDRDLAITTLFVKLVDPEKHQIVRAEGLVNGDKGWVLMGESLYEVSVSHIESVDGAFQVIDFGNGISLRRSLTMHVAGPKDSLVWAYVYNPDPLTAAKTSYGGQFKNFGDSTNKALDEARVLVQVPMRSDGDSFWAGNEHVRIISSGGGYITSNSDTFNFTRDQDGFEAVNAVYHVTSYKNYLRELDLEDALDYRISLNPRGLWYDQSNFVPSSQKKGRGTINLGYSTENRPHVDDGEDADVIIHELGHAISRYVNGTMNSSLDRESIDDGFCDYLACGYSKDISAYNWEKLFNWDGHNEFWDSELRYCSTDKTMADFIQVRRSGYDKYFNGEIFAGMAMDFRNRVPSQVADRIVITAAKSFAGSMKFIDIAHLLMDAEEGLFEKQYAGTLCSVLHAYGFVSDSFCTVSIANIPTTEFHISFDAFQKNRLLVSDLSINEGVFTLYSTQGKTILSRRFNGREVSEALPQLSKGVYLLEFRSQVNDFRAIQRVVRY